MANTELSRGRQRRTASTTSCESIPTSFARLSDITRLSDKNRDLTNYSILTARKQVALLSISCTVSEIFSVKEWRDLETGGKSRSRSLKMAPFDRSYTTFYWLAVVNIALCSTIVELFDVE